MTGSDRGTSADPTPGRRIAFKVGTVVVGLVVALVLLVVADRLVVSMFVEHADRSVLIPHWTVSLKTPEFDWTATTSRQGFRDREYDFEEKTAFRVMTIGDSFTFGWGVEREKIWPRMLERALRDGGIDVEVVNAGWPGIGPVAYTWIAEHLVEVVKPDLVLVALLQGDDLPQIEEQTAFKDDAGKRRRGFAASLLPNLMQLKRIARRRKKGERDLGRRWAAMARARVATLDGDMKARYVALDPKPKALFLAGQLNPGLVTLALSNPDRLCLGVTDDGPASKRLLDELAKRLGRMRVVCRAHGADLLAVSVPWGPFVHAAWMDRWRRMGFRVDPRFLDSCLVDAGLRRAADAAGVPFHSVLNAFRAAAAKEALFFEWDGHFTAAGHATFGRALAPAVLGRVTR